MCLEHSPYDTALDLEDARRAFPVDYSVGELRELTQYIERHQLDPMNEVDCWARQFLPASGSIGIFELLTRLSHGIHQDFRYRRREAKGIQPPVETLRLGHGSCRDFAMLMIEAARVWRGDPAPSAPRSWDRRTPDRRTLGAKSLCRAPGGSASIRLTGASAVQTLFLSLSRATFGKRRPSAEPMRETATLSRAWRWRSS